MNTQPEQLSHEMTPGEITAVEEGMADFDAGRIVTEEEFDQRIKEAIARRRAEAVSVTAHQTH